MSDYGLSEDEEYMYEQDMTYEETYPKEYEKVKAAISKLAEHGKITEQEADNYNNMFTNKLLETNAEREGTEQSALELVEEAKALDKKGGKKSRKRKTAKKSKKSRKRKTAKKSKKSRKRKTAKKRKKSRK